MQRDLRLMHIVVFLTSLAVVLFEVSLTRIFAVILWYHFVFLVMSISILGLGVGAGLFTLAPFRNRFKVRGYAELALYALMFGVMIPISVMSTLIYPFRDVIIGYAGIIFVPFVFAGLFSAGAFHSFGEYAQRLYFADLVGAALGSILIILLLPYVGAINAAIFIGILPLVASYLIYRRVVDKRHKWLSLICIIIVSTLGLVNINFDLIGIDFGFNPETAKTMFSRLRSEDYEIVFSKWTPFARTDVVESLSGREKVIYTDGGAGSVMINFDGDLSSVEYLKHDTAYFPFKLGNNGKVLILGSGAGKDVLLALLAGSGDITAVEINRSVVQAMKEFSDFNGNLYGREEVRVVIGDGRNFVERDNGFYDLIYLPLVFTQSAEGVGFALAENYIFTVEAFGSYLDRLAPNGRVALLLHDTYDLTKAMVMVYQMFIHRGLSAVEVANRMVIAYKPHPGYNGVMYPVLVFRNEPFSSEEITSIRSSIWNMGMVGVHVPGLNYPVVATPLISETQSLQEFVHSVPFDVRPATDNSPFFYNSERGLPDVLRLLLVVIVFAFLGTLVYAFSKAKKIASDPSGRRLMWWMTISFSGLGAGYMLLEVALIQKLVLIFGNPTVAFSGVLFLLLISGGLGSLISSAYTDVGLTRIISISTLTVGVIGALYSISLSSITQTLIGATLTQQVVGVILIVAPLGFLMGIPFSSSLRLARVYDENVIGLAWAVNGITSVFGSVLAVSLAMSHGFSAVFAIGAICYLLVSATSHYIFIVSRNGKETVN